MATICYILLCKVPKIAFFVRVHINEYHYPANWKIVSTLQTLSYSEEGRFEEGVWFRSCGISRILRVRVSVIFSILRRYNWVSKPQQIKVSLIWFHSIWGYCLSFKLISSCICGWLYMSGVWFVGVEIVKTDDRLNWGRWTIMLCNVLYSIL